MRARWGPGQALLATAAYGRPELTCHVDLELLILAPGDARREQDPREADQQRGGLLYARLRVWAKAEPAGPSGATLSRGQGYIDSEARWR